MHEGNHFTVMVFIHTKNQHTFQSSMKGKKKRKIKKPFARGVKSFYSEQVSTCVHLFSQPPLFPIRSHAIYQVGKQKKLTQKQKELRT